MSAEEIFLPGDLVQTDPALALLRLAALSAGPSGQLEKETLDLMFERVKSGALAKPDPVVVWPELVRGLMAPKPSNMIRALHVSGALRVLLPGVAAVFGVPQIADDPPQVDIGQHLLRVLDETARCDAPLAVRFAALVMHVGKYDSPPEHLPVHYRHVERGAPRIEALCERYGVPDDCRELALLALAECERVHRVGRVRAGPVAALLSRVGAFERPGRFRQLMMLCACDYGAYGQRRAEDYLKAALLEIALQACQNVDATKLRIEHLSTGESDALHDARAAAIAAAFRSERWSSGSE
jgi:tRNA nucleotidyltransferase (CCA-adding enzyme)